MTVHSEQNQVIAKEILNRIAMENRQMNSFDVAEYAKRTNRMAMFNDPAGNDELHRELDQAPYARELRELAQRHRGERR